MKQYKCLIINNQYGNIILIIIQSKVFFSELDEVEVIPFYILNINYDSHAVCYQCIYNATSKLRHGKILTTIFFEMLKIVLTLYCSFTQIDSGPI